MPKSSPFPYLSFLELNTTTQRDIHPLWIVHSGVSESPSSCSSSLLQNLGCTALNLCVAVQEPWAMLHWIVVFKRLEPSEARIPAWDPDSRNGLTTLRCLNPWWVWHLPGPMSMSIHSGGEDQRLRASKCTCDQKSKAQFHEPRAKREPKACNQHQKPERASPHPLFRKPSLLESHAVKKTVGMSSFSLTLF